MFDDLKKMLGADADPARFASEIQELSNNGRFDPLALFAGQARFQAVFIAPFTPALTEARDQFLRDGSGPLAGITAKFQSEEVSAAAAQQAAQGMFTAAQGMCVIVLANDQGLDTVPQLFFGSLEDSFIEHALKTCGDAFAHADALRSGLIALRANNQESLPWWRLHAGGPRGDADFWVDLAAQLVSGLDAGVFGAPPERLRDLAWWVGMAASGCEDGGVAIPAAAQAAIVRCVALGGEPGAAFSRLAVCFREFPDEDLVQLLHRLTEVAVARGEGAQAAIWLATHAQALIDHIGDSYDVQAARFKALASTGAAADVLVPVAAALLAADRKTARHELTREPIWRVTVADPGDVIDTAAAADLVGRSPAFIAKRLEQGTIPTVRQDDQVRLPRQALLAWKAIMDAHKLLD